MKNTKDLLPEEVTSSLTEGSLKEIEAAFKEKLDLTVETALTQQDDLYAKKLQQLIEAIDKDHTAKLKKIVEAIDKDNAGKLKAVIRKYERTISEEAKSFKSKLVESISNYLEEYIDETIPTAAIEEATKNRTATTVLSNLRKVLAVDSALMSESVKEAVIDGKDRIDELTKQVNELAKENKVIKEKYLATKANLLLESKTASFPNKKKEFLMRVLSDKTPKFIEENFDYTAKLFDKNERERLSVIKEQAYESRVVKTDAPSISQTPKQEQNSNPYLEELKRVR